MSSFTPARAGFSGMESVSVNSLRQRFRCGKYIFIWPMYSSFVMGFGSPLFTSSTNWAQCSIISSIVHSCKNFPSL